MWKVPIFLDTLVELINHEYVYEIIIINNVISSTPYTSILLHPKIRVIGFAYNTYVNPAWNFGVLQAKMNNLCILSDDVVFDMNVFSKVDEYLTDNSIVVVDVPTDPMHTDMQIVKLNSDIHANHFGCLMFCTKNSWIPIPAGLDLYFGDHWIWDNTLHRGNDIYLIKNLTMDTTKGTTCIQLPEIIDKLYAESFVYLFYKENLKRT